MITRLFPIDGTSFPHRKQLATCALLSCLAVGTTIDTALDAITAQIRAAWAARLADLAVRIEVTALMLSEAHPPPPQWLATVTVVTDETPLQGMLIEERMGLPYDAGVVTNLRAHLTDARSLAAYAEVMVALEAYLGAEGFPALLRPALQDLHDQAAARCGILRDEARHLREHTVAYRMIAADLAQQPRN